MKRAGILAVAALGLGLVIQLVPYGRVGTNPPVVAEPEWNSARTRELFHRACRDCHTNETAWPWYSRIAPVSWLVRWDVEEGREHFNASEAGDDDRDEAAEMVREGEMPLWYYLPLHPEAQLTDPEKAALVEGLAATFGDEEAAPHAH